MIQYFQITAENELDALSQKSAQYENIHFQFSDEYLLSLKKSLRGKNACQIFAKDTSANAIAGYIAAVEDLHSPYLTVMELFVDPDFQQQGIGKTLLQKVSEFAQKHNFPGIVTQTEFENIPAQKLYEKLGFQNIENPNWKEGKTYKLDF